MILAGDTTVAQLVLNALAALVGTLLAGAAGIYYALARFRREKAFERRLEWHEKAVSQLSNSATILHKLSVGLEAPELVEDPEGKWDVAFKSFPGEEFELQAEMYASPSSFEAIREAREDQKRVIVASSAIFYSKEPIRSEEEKDRLAARLISIASKSMLHAASLLASDVRQFLGLERINRETRLYDEKHRKRFPKSDDEDVPTFARRMGSSDT